DPDSTPSASMGTELTVSIRGRQLATTTTPDLLPHVEPLPEDRDARQFLALHDVASAVRDEAGIQLVSVPVSPAETPYDGTCSGGTFPTNKGNPPMCCQVTGVYTATYSKSATGSIAQRFGNNPVVTCRQSD